MTAPYLIEVLNSEHDRSEFSCGRTELDRYLREQARQDIKRRLANCYVAVEHEAKQIAGFYTLSATSIALHNLPAEVVKKHPRYPAIPAALIGRLAIAEQHQGQGLGAALIVDALSRIAAQDMAIFAVLVEAKDVRAQAFYEHFGFTLLPGSDRKLVIPLETALRAVPAR